MSDYQIKAILWLLLLTCQPLSTFNRETLGELYKPLQDSLVTRCVEIMDLDKTKTTQSSAASILKSIWSKVYPKPRRCWLPTGCLVRVSWIIHKPDKQIDFYIDRMFIFSPEITWCSPWGATKDVFDCFWFQLPTRCEDTWWTSPIGFN